MARRPSASPGNSPNSQLAQANKLVVSQPVDFDIQRELDQLEEMILDSARIPFTQLTLVDEEKLLNQLDLVRINLPQAFEKALAVIQRKQEILQEADDYARRIIQSAQQRAAEILDETGIIQQADIQASQIRHQAQQESEALRHQINVEVEQSRQNLNQQLQQLRQQTLAECQDIQDGAYTYADSLLTNLEHELSEMLRVVHNGKQHLSANSSTRNSAPKTTPAPASRRRH
jgi:cell division septum initiation protein DivIVA